MGHDDAVAEKAGATKGARGEGGRADASAGAGLSLIVERRRRRAGGPAPLK